MIDQHEWQSGMFIVLISLLALVYGSVKVWRALNG